MLHKSLALWLNRVFRLIGVASRLIKWFGFDLSEGQCRRCRLLRGLRYLLLLWRRMGIWSVLSQSGTDINTSADSSLSSRSPSYALTLMDWCIRLIVLANVDIGGCMVSMDECKLSTMFPEKQGVGRMVEAQDKSVFIKEDHTIIHLYS